MTIESAIKQIAAALPPMGPGTRDVIHAGDASAELRGVAVTFQATRAVLDRAVSLGANLIVTHEPTFYTDGSIEPLKGDPVYQAKREFIESNKLVVWRNHDAWHVRRPDGILTGMAKAFGWQDYLLPGEAHIYEPPASSLAELASHLKRSLGVGSIRCIGRADKTIRRVTISCGSAGWDAHRRLLRTPGVDALICGEVREWETPEYVRDSDQALIVLGHCNSEEQGMAYLAEWLSSVLPGVRIDFVPAGDPFRHI